MHPNAATSHAKIFRGLINTKRDAIAKFNDAESLDFTKQVDHAMLEYIPEIERLSDMPGGLELACELIIYLSAQSYCTRFTANKNMPWGGSHAASRPSNAPADGCLALQNPR
jgi:hypothetical protein